MFDQSEVFPAGHSAGYKKDMECVIHGLYGGQRAANLCKDDQCSQPSSHTKNWLVVWNIFYFP
jgi:hypothetical protein